MDPDYPNGLVRNFHRLSGRHCREEFDPTFAPTGNSSNSMCREAGAVQGGEQKKEVQVVQYKEGARSSRRRYRWCSTRRGAVHSSCHCKPIGKSIGQNPVSIRRHHDHHLRMRSDYWDPCDETVLLCYWDLCLPWFAQINKHQTLVGDVLEQIMNWTEQAFQ